jgi:transposase
VAVGKPVRACWLHSKVEIFHERNKRVDCQRVQGDDRGRGADVAKRTSQRHSPTFKAKGALAAVKGERTLAELAQQYEVHTTQIMHWRSQLLENAADIIDLEAQPVEPGIDVKMNRAGFAGGCLV